MKANVVEMASFSPEMPNLLTRFMKHRLFPAAFQWIVLVLLLFTAYAALFTTNVPERNFALVFVWIFWGTVAPISLWLVGRYWCAMCPFHLLGNILNKLVGPKRPIPLWVRRYGFWVALVLFVAIVWFEHAVDIFQSTTLTLLLLVPVLLGTVIGALLFRNIEFWCHALCPLLPIARNYSMLSSIEVRGSEAACSGCSVKACYKGDQSISGCPVGLYLRNLDSMQECIACGQCFRACPTSGALSARFRGFLDEFKRIRVPDLDAAVFAAIWPGALAIHYFTLIPSGDSIMRGWMESAGLNYVTLWTLVYVGAIAASLALTGAGASLTALISGESLKRGFARYSYAFIPLGIGIHTGFNMPRFFGEKGLNRATHNLLEIFGYTLDGRIFVLSQGALNVLMFGLLAAGFVVSLVALRHVAGSNGSKGGLFSTLPAAASMSAIAFVVGTMFWSLY